MQLCPASFASLAVVNQLGQWGDFASLVLFQVSLSAMGVTCPDDLAHRMRFWLTIAGSIAQVCITHTDRLVTVQCCHWADDDQQICRNKCTAGCLCILVWNMIVAWE